jgi:magnesium chelatase subunit D
VARGRYVRSRPSAGFRDLALDATLRAAAARARPEGSGRLRLRVRPADLHSKVRERKAGSLLVFLVDTSSSMGTEQRLLATQGAILALLVDAYQRRDRVGLLAFRETFAETILTPTNSVEKAKRAFERIAIGGTTPLSAGLLAAATLIDGALRRDPALRPLLILITDGMPNIALGGADPLAEALDLCRAIRARRMAALVLDTEGGSLARSLESGAVGKGHEIAEALGARYLPLAEVTGAAILDALRH